MNEEMLNWYRVHFHGSADHVVRELVSEVDRLRGELAWEQQTLRAVREGADQLRNAGRALVGLLEWIGDPTRPRPTNEEVLSAAEHFKPGAIPSVPDVIVSADHEN